MNELLKLAERVEKATGPDRELDEAIYEVLGAVRPGTCDLYWTAPSGSERHYSSLIPRFTASLDDAMTLVPEGQLWRVGHSTLYDGWAALNRVHPDHCEREDETFANATTPALALTAAALRARANKEGECEHMWRYRGEGYHGSHKGDDMYVCDKCSALEYR